jgi:hypothetical protein
LVKDLSSRTPIMRSNSSSGLYRSSAPQKLHPAPSSAPPLATSGTED